MILGVVHRESLRRCDGIVEYCWLRIKAHQPPMAPQTVRRDAPRLSPSSVGSSGWFRAGFEIALPSEVGDALGGEGLQCELRRIVSETWRFLSVFEEVRSLWKENVAKDGGSKSLHCQAHFARETLAKQSRLAMCVGEVRR